GTPWQAGTRILGLNLTAIAVWVGPVLMTIWFLGWTLSLSPNQATPLPMSARPLDIVHETLSWAGWATTRPDSLALWLAGRPVIGPLAVAAVTIGVSLRHDLLVSLGTLLAVQSLGVQDAVSGIIISTLAIAVASAMIMRGNDRQP